MKGNRRKITILLVLCLLVLPLLPIRAAGEETDTLIEPPYSIVLKNWQDKNIKDNISYRDVVQPSQYQSKGTRVSVRDSYGYESGTLRLSDQEKLEFSVNVPEEGLYQLGLDYYPIEENVLPLEIRIEINDELQFFESRKIPLETHWERESNETVLDRYGNEVLPKQKMIQKWYYTKAKDSKGIESVPLRFYLKAGENRFTLINLQKEFLIGNIYIEGMENNVSYIDYILKDEFNNKDKLKELIIIEAEQPIRKNSPSIQMKALKEVSLHPYDTKTLKLNIIDETWKKGGQSLTWNFEVKKEGFYNLTWKAKQKDKNNLPVYRKIQIDGEVPFQEFERYGFPYSKKWKNMTLADSEQNPYSIYLTEGVHEITATVDISPYQVPIDEINRITKEINDFALEIKKLTGNNQDPYREWIISDYIPDIEERINGWVEVLDQQYQYINSLSVTGREPSLALTIKTAKERLKKLVKNPDDLPNQLPALSEGSGSVAQSLGDLAQNLLEQPLLVDRIYLHGEDAKLPKPLKSIWARIFDGIVRFFMSFVNNPYDMKEQTENELVVWINRPRQYVEILQQMVDADFTKQTGIKVNFSIMPNDQKVILSNAAETNPDVALGLSTQLPYELAMRGAAADLRQFEDFDNFIEVFSPGALIPYIIGDSAYAIPETQDFWVLFYRHDLLNKLNIPIPNSWQEVISILPDLQRYGMNFYTPLAGVGAHKPFTATTPYIYQFGGDIFSPDGTHSTLDTEKSLEAINFMTDSFTMYSLPAQVPNFYNHFRYGTLPIGISNFTTYLQLLNAAPEISGNWSIALYPGIPDEDKVIQRWAPGSALSCMVFENSSKKEEAWKFLKWYMSTETQIDYGMNLTATLGQEYLWNTANVEAFRELPFQEEHKDVILEQWEWLREIPRMPGSYMAEREISNIWSKVVFNGIGVREAVDDATININRELIRKMEEFGYVKNGKFVKEYKVPTIEQVESWVNRGEE